jgi:hypothetical protein
MEPPLPVIAVIVAKLRTTTPTGRRGESPRSNGNVSGGDGEGDGGI